MSLDIAWWSRLLGTLALEATCISALAWLSTSLTKHSQLQRLILRTTIATWICLWGAEFAGIRTVIPQPAQPLPKRYESPTARAQTRLVAPQKHSTRPVGNKVFLENSESFHERSNPTNQVSDTAIRSLIQDSTVLSIPTSRPVYWPAWIWLTGMLALFTRMASGQFLSFRRFSGLGVYRVPVFQNPNDLARVRRLESLLGLRNVRVINAEDCKSPLVFGILRPTIILPLNFAGTFNTSQREAIVAHELAHLASHDPLWLLVADLLVAVAWWHPAGYWLRRRLRACSEIAADQASHLVPNGSVALSEALIVLGKQLMSDRPRYALDAAGTGLKSDLAFRIRALLTKPFSATVRPIWWLIAPTAAIASVVGLASSPLPMAGQLSPAELVAQRISNPVPSRMVGPSEASTFDSHLPPRYVTQITKSTLESEEDSRLESLPSYPIGVVTSLSGQKVILRCRYLQITRELAESSGLDSLVPAPDPRPMIHSQYTLQASNSPTGQTITNYLIGETSNHWTTNARQIDADRYAALNESLKAIGVIDDVDNIALEIYEFDTGVSCFRDSKTLIHHATVKSIKGRICVSDYKWATPANQLGTTLSVRSCSPIGTSALLVFIVASREIEPAPSNSSNSTSIGEPHMRTCSMLGIGDCHAGDAVIIPLLESQETGHNPLRTREFVIAEVAAITK